MTPYAARDAFSALLLVPAPVESDRVKKSSLFNTSHLPSFLSCDAQCYSLTEMSKTTYLSSDSCLIIHSHCKLSFNHEEAYFLM